MNDFGKQMTHTWNINAGLFKTDPNNSFGGRAFELVSRFTWQAPQTVAGYAFVSGANAIDKVDGVTHGYGMTAVDMGLKGAISIGFYTAGPRGYKAAWRDHLFVHEYGHYIQSQQYGPSYLLIVGLASLQSATIDEIFNVKWHDTRWFEADANYKAAQYFDKHYGSGSSGYFHGSRDHFDRNSFVEEGEHSPYTNPRDGRRNYWGHPTGSTWHWTDPLIHIPSWTLVPWSFIF